MESLSIEGCPITENENYRDEIFKLVPNLKIIDERDRDGKAISEDSNPDGDEISSDEEQSESEKSEEPGSKKNFCSEELDEESKSDVNHAAVPASYKHVEKPIENFFPPQVTEESFHN